MATAAMPQWSRPLGIERTHDKYLHWKETMTMRTRLNMRRERRTRLIDGAGRVLWASAIAALCGACTLSCATVERRPGVTTVNGAYERYFAAPPQAVLDAAWSAYQHFGLLLEERTREKVTARTSQGVLVSTRVASDGSNTRARVLVDPGRDATLSMGILDEIGGRLVRP